MKISATLSTLVLPILLIGEVSCGPTTETVGAPFKLTSDFTSSTSGSSALPDPSAKAHQQLQQFVASAYDGVSGNIAQGSGEYLTSLAVLAGIPADAQAAFRTEMQSHYAVFSNPLLSRNEAEALVVNHAWSAGYGKIQQRHASVSSGLLANLDNRLLNVP
ncbi:MAG: DUF3015 family protein [Nitrospira sp.]